MYGFSYPGAAQLLPASVQPPHLVTIIPAMTSSDYHHGWTYEGGALDRSFAKDWPMTTIANSHVRRYPDGAAIDAVMNQAVADEFTKWYWFLPLKDFPPLFPNDPRVAPYFFDWLKHPDNDAYWQRWSLRTRYGQIKVPALHFDGWYDIFIDGALENFNRLRHGAGSQFARDNQQLVVGPWLHIPWLQKVGQIDFGPQAANPIDTLQLRWSPIIASSICTAAARRTPCKATAGSAPTSRRTSAMTRPRPMRSRTTRPIRCRASAAASRPRCRAGPTISGRSSAGPTCWSTRPRR
jgi:putative CocE/NonD family hydrolase